MHPLDWDEEEVVTRDRRWPRGTGLDRVTPKAPRIEIVGLDEPADSRNRRALPLPRIAGLPVDPTEEAVDDQAETNVHQRLTTRAATALLVQIAAGEIAPGEVDIAVDVPLEDIDGVEQDEVEEIDAADLESAPGIEPAEVAAFELPVIGEEPDTAPCREDEGSDEDGDDLPGLFDDSYDAIELETRRTAAARLLLTPLPTRMPLTPPRLAVPPPRLATPPPPLLAPATPPPPPIDDHVEDDEHRAHAWQRIDAQEDEAIAALIEAAPHREPKPLLLLEGYADLPDTWSLPRALPPPSAPPRTSSFAPLARSVAPSGFPPPRRARRPRRLLRPIATMVVAALAAFGGWWLAPTGDTRVVVMTVPAAEPAADAPADAPAARPGEATAPQAAAPASPPAAPEPAAPTVGHLAISVETVGARLLLVHKSSRERRVLAGPWPSTLDLDFGDYEVVATRFGHRAAVLRVHLDAAEPDARITVALAPAPRARRQKLEDIYEP
jgi:hypothetical protein